MLASSHQTQVDTGAGGPKRGPNRRIGPEAARFGKNLRILPVIMSIDVCRRSRTGSPLCGK